jgi:hypothetical protein
VRRTARRGADSRRSARRLAESAPSAHRVTEFRRDEGRAEEADADGRGPGRLRRARGRSHESRPKRGWARIPRRGRRTSERARGARPVLGHRRRSDQRGAWTRSRSVSARQAGRPRIRSCVSEEIPTTSCGCRPPIASAPRKTLAMMVRCSRSLDGGAEEVCLTGDGSIRKHGPDSGNPSHRHQTGFARVRG